MADCTGPVLDDEVRRRLGRRYGPDVGPWFDALPPRLQFLAHRWRLDLGPLVRRGTVSVVLRCRTDDGRAAVLKVSPDRDRIDAEARALAGWHTRHVPEVIGAEPAEGALLLEAIEPGTALDESRRRPGTAELSTLLDGLHRQAPGTGPAPPVAERIDALYRAGEANYGRRPDLQGLVPRTLYQRGRQAALVLASQPSRRVVLHGDLTPANVLDGGPARGLVAVDPAACVGDPAFDTVDLLLWRVGDLADLVVRCRELAGRMGVAQERPLRWCACFAAMAALEQAEARGRDEPPPRRIGMLLDLAATA